MRPIPHNQPTETDTRENQERPTTRKRPSNGDERPELTDDEIWLEVQEF